MKIQLKYLFILFLSLFNLNLFCAEVRTSIPSVNSAFKKPLHNALMLAKLNEMAASCNEKTFFSFIEHNPRLYLDALKIAIIKNINLCQSIWTYIVDSKLIRDPLSDLSILISFIYENVSNERDKVPLIMWFLEYLNKFEDPKNRNILHHLCIQEKLEVIKYLRKCGFVSKELVNEKDAHGYDPLFYAVKFLDFECVQYLVDELGASIDVKKINREFHNDMHRDKIKVQSIMSLLRRSINEKANLVDVKTNSAENVKR